MGSFTLFEIPSNNLGKTRLAATRRAVEEHALGCVHAEELELVGVLDRVLNGLLELALDVLEAADVLPLDVGHLDCRLAQRRGVRQLVRRWKSKAGGSLRLNPSQTRVVVFLVLLRTLAWCTVAQNSSKWFK